MTTEGFDVATIPLSLYLHIPWCVRKCPYCDFNSHQAQAMDEQAYVAQLLADLDTDLNTHAVLWQQRPLHSIFFGGGTPSVFSAAAIGAIIDGVAQRLTFEPDIEITLEANPGTAEAEKFRDFRAAGVNRLSIGVQSFSPAHLQALGRIHDDEQAIRAIALAQRAGFARINVDLMHGLPEQTPAQALADLQTALDSGVTHLSWYQLTIEPNTVFYRQPPPLPVDDVLWDIQQQGLERLAESGFGQYEVSAFSKPGQQARHNLNYWQFGDYFGIGAGAHGKLTAADGSILRYSKTRLPQHYLARRGDCTAESHRLEKADIPGEFMMNALRLREGVQAALFPARTGLPLQHLQPAHEQMVARGLLSADPLRLQTTAQGFLFLNDVIAAFL